jgi:hypothetical protein
MNTNSNPPPPLRHFKRYKGIVDLNVSYAFVLFHLQHRPTTAFRSLGRCFLATLRGILNSAECFTVSGIFIQIWMFSLTVLNEEGGQILL